MILVLIHTCESVMHHWFCVPGMSSISSAKLLLKKNFLVPQEKSNKSSENKKSHKHIYSSVLIFNLDDTKERIVDIIGLCFLYPCLTRFCTKFSRMCIYILIYAISRNISYLKRRNV